MQAVRIFRSCIHWFTREKRYMVFHTKLFHRRTIFLNTLISYIQPDIFIISHLPISNVYKCDSCTSFHAEHARVLCLRLSRFFCILHIIHLVPLIFITIAGTTQGDVKIQMRGFLPTTVEALFKLVSTVKVNVMNAVATNFCILRVR